MTPTQAEEIERDLKEIEAAALRRALRAALRREPTPRELRRAQGAFFENGDGR